MLRSFSNGTVCMGLALDLNWVSRRIFETFNFVEILGLIAHRWLCFDTVGLG